MSAARRRENPHEIDTIPPPPGEDFYRAPTKVTAVSQALAKDMARARERFQSVPPPSGIVPRRHPPSQPSVPDPASLPHLFDIDDVAFEPTIRQAQHPYGPSAPRTLMPPPLVAPPPARAERSRLSLLAIVVLTVLALCTFAMGYTVIAVFV